MSYSDETARYYAMQDDTPWPLNLSRMALWQSRRGSHSVSSPIDHCWNCPSQNGPEFHMLVTMSHVSVRIT
jgi:hypothetical protein